jgi:hypothetical protein
MMTSARRPTATLESAANALLQAIAARGSEIGNRPLTLHWPLVGSRFDRGVLVIGQAVYGWFGDWRAAEVANVERRRAVISEARDLFDERPDRMDWIDGHRVWNSPFWRVVRDVTERLAPGDGPFYSRVAWVNLYPVAPNDIKANPGGALLEAQTVPAAAFVNAAIEAIDPSVVLVLAGPYVWPFVEPLGLDHLNDANRPLYRIGTYRDRRWVVGMHPGGASRRGWGPGRYGQLIIETADALGGAGDIHG